MSHALRGFYELAGILIVLDEILLLEISNFARQLKLSLVIGDDHPVVTHLTASLWFRSMELTITSSTSKSRGPSNERKNVAAAEKQLESTVYRLTQEGGRWPFLTPRLENATEKTREDAPPLVKQIWDFLEEQLEVAEKREMTVARFVTAANEVTIGGFWREHARGELRTRRDHEILEFLSPCWGKEFMAGVYSAKETIFGAFIQEILNMPIRLLLALYLVYLRSLFNMGPAYMFSRDVDTFRIDGYLALVLLTHGELMSFHRLMKYGEPLLMERTHSSIDTYLYKCAAGLKTLLVQYLLMQNRHLTGEEKSPKTRDEWRKVNRGMPLLTDLCLAMRSDPMGMIRGLEEVVTCIYGPAVTYAFPDPLVTAYRYSVTHLSLISILDGTTLNWCQQEVLRAQMSNTVLFGKVNDPELVTYSFRGQLQCRMGGKPEGPIETYPKFWNLNPLTANVQFEVREALRILERVGLENKLPVWDDGRMIVEEGHIALKGDEMMFATRRYRAPYGLEQVEMRQEGKELDAAGPLYVALTEYKTTGPTKPSPLSVGTPGDKRSGPVEDRFRRILEKRGVESGEESMDETLSEAGEDIEVGNTPEPKPSEEEFTTQEMLKDLSEKIGQTLPRQL